VEPLSEQLRHLENEVGRLTAENTSLKHKLDTLRKAAAPTTRIVRASTQFAAAQPTNTTTTTSVKLPPLPSARKPSTAHRTSSSSLGGGGGADAASSVVASADTEFLECEIKHLKAAAATAADAHEAEVQTLRSELAEKVSHFPFTHTLLVQRLIH